MLPRRRLRTFTLWIGTLLCVLIAAAFVVTGWWWTAVVSISPRGPSIGVGGGVMDVFWGYPISSKVLFLRNDAGLTDWNTWVYVYGVAGQGVGRASAVPLYAVFAAVAVPTLAVWWFGRKPVKPGHCRCGYNLTGNQSGVCPECGDEVHV